ncbi:hypothetical protein NPIL_428651 [Nephila pilipes]|uniref:Uncharacterized protein n=1 Tax=Nephila pilipes TaxID=299642 RepID=A0A8X6NHN5_NEPPI|nr:hypothetical protein NPIL_428651 [Nephila pilipes]
MKVPKKSVQTDSAVHFHIKLSFHGRLIHLAVSSGKVLTYYDTFCQQEGEVLKIFNSTPLWFFFCGMASALRRQKAKAAACSGSALQPKYGPTAAV